MLTLEHNSEIKNSHPQPTAAAELIQALQRGRKPGGNNRSYRGVFVKFQGCTSKVLPVLRLVSQYGPTTASIWYFPKTGGHQSRPQNTRIHIAMTLKTSTPKIGRHRPFVYMESTTRSLERRYRTLFFETIRSWLDIPSGITGTLTQAVA